ncbi:MAG: shikimate dehydrogenase [Desulfosarcinaceae bacterium]
MKINSRTELYGVIGDPVGHSLSPVLHNAAFRQTAYPGVYLAFKVRDLAGAVQGMRALNIRGLSVTIPHKVAIMPMLDEVDEQAEKVGAVNTVVNRDGRLMGTNTDGIGAVAALKTAGNLTGKRVAVLGAGGAARAVIVGLQQEGAEVMVYNRGTRRGRQLAAELSATFIPLDQFDGRGGKIDILVNTTPVGMLPHTDALPVRAEYLDSRLLVMDIVYNPLETALLKAAGERGCRTIDGTAMFVHQGARQFSLWTGLKPPVAVMRDAVLAALAP